MILSILKHELRYRFSQWISLLLFGIMVFQGIWYTKGNFDYYVNEDLLMNAASVFYKNSAGCGILMVIIVAVITGGVLYKDLEYKTGQWLFSKPIDEKKFYLGRFISAFSINALLALGYVLGMLLVPYSGIGEAHRFGPTPVGQLFHGFFVLTLPNILLLTSLIFSSIVFTRKMAPGYLAVLLTVVFFLVMQTTAEGSGATPLIMLVDPFGYVATDYVISFFTPEEKNIAYLPVNGYILYNRIIWLSVSLLLVALSLRTFSFKQFLSSPTKKSKALHIDLPTSTPKISNSIQPTLSFTIRDYFNKLFDLTLLEFKNITRPTSFKVILGIVLLMITLQNLMWNASYYIGPTQPMTFVMTQFRLSFGVFIMILIMIWSGELFFKDKTVGIYQIIDALPVPTWTIMFARFLAMVLVAFVLAFSFVIIGITIQILKGGIAQVDLSLYVYDLLGYNWGWLTYVCQIALVFVIAGITNNRFATHIISVGIFFGILLAFELNLLEQVRFGYPAVPGVEDYSEISKYGIWYISAFWHFLMWAILAAAFILIGIASWKRGGHRQTFAMFSLNNKQLNMVGKVSLLLLIAGFFFLQSFIVQQVNRKDNYTPSEEELQISAQYEKQYGYVKSAWQPKFKEVVLTLDFFPQERKATFEAEIMLVNDHSLPIDSLYLNINTFAEIHSIEWNGQSIVPSWEDEILDIMGYSLPQALIQNDTAILSLHGTKQYSGFTQSGESPQADLTFNGSFGSIREFLPIIGYNEERELKKNRERVDHKLPRLTARMAPLDDSVALYQDAFAEDALWVKGKLIISTDTNQIVIAPGKLEENWREKNRHYYSFSVQEAAPFNWYVGSSDLHILHESMGAYQLSIYYHPEHPFNLSLYMDAFKKAIRFVDEQLSEFPVQQVRLYEIPYYQGKYYSFPHAITISEKEGWYADTSGIKEKVYIYQTLASQVLTQWISQQVHIANVQGADMLKVAFPEALALQFVELELGKEAVEVLVQKKQDLYGKNRSEEPNVEPPLLYADGADYLEANKGALVLFEDSRKVGFDNFNDHLLEWIADKGSDHGTFKQWLESFIQDFPELEKDAYH